MQERTERKAKKGILLLGAAIVAIGTATAAATPAMAQGRTVSLDVGAQSLATALNRIGRQTGTEIIFAPATVRGMRAPALRGQFTVEQALDRLLSGSGLRYRRTGQGAYVIEATPGEAQAGGAAAESVSAENQEIVVTGTNIRGAGPTGSNALVVSGDELRSSGYTSLDDALRVVQQAGPAIGENANPVGRDPSGNTAGRSGVDLRGIGLDTTLVLVNGQRTASGGLNGRFSDITNIPMSAIERVEILLDGGSAVYGSDAIGGVVNVILRRDYQGAETNLRGLTYNGDSFEYQASQIFGFNWNSGNILFGGQYNFREALPRTARSFTGSGDKRIFGGDDFRESGGNPGNILDPVTGVPVYGIPSGQDGRNLQVSDLLPTLNIYDRVRANDLLQERTTYNGFADITQHIGNSLTAQLHIRYAEQPISRRATATVSTIIVPSSNPFFVDPFGGLSTISVTYNLSNDFDFSFRGTTTNIEVQPSLSLRIGQNWQIRLNGSYSREAGRIDQSGINSTEFSSALADNNPDTAFNPFGDGSNTNPATIAKISTIQPNDYTSSNASSQLVADGPLFRLPAGPVRLAAGGEFRREGLSTVGLNDRRADLAREVLAGFAEIAVPIVNPQMGIGGIYSLDLSAAARFDHYSDFGSAFVPRAGVRWAITPRLAVRGSWSNSFRAPSLTQVDQAAFNPGSIVPATLVDPLSPTGSSLVLLRLGLIPDLREETSTSWSGGVDYDLSQNGGPKLSLTYSNIDYTNRIADPLSAVGAQAFLATPALDSLVIRNPSAAQIAPLCDDPSSALPAFICKILPYGAIVDSRVRNIATTRVETLDFRLDQTVPLENGRLLFRVDAAHNLRNARAVARGAPLLDVVGTLGNPPSWRARGQTTLTSGNFMASAAINYTSGERDPGGTLIPLTGRATTERTISSWTTIDMNFSYRSHNNNGIFKGTEFELSIVNLFNTAPPFVNTLLGYDGANANPYGRIVGLSIRKAW